jgi:hypothetical protein
VVLQLFHSDFVPISHRFSIDGRSMADRLCSDNDSTVIVKTFRSNVQQSCSDHKVIPQHLRRLNSDCASIADCLRIDDEVIAKQFHSDSVPISQCCKLIADRSWIDRRSIADRSWIDRRSIVDRSCSNNEEIPQRFRSDCAAFSVVIANHF